MCSYTIPLPLQVKAERHEGMQMDKKQADLRRHRSDAKRKAFSEKRLEKTHPANEAEEPEEEKDTWAFENPARERLRSTGILQ